MALRISNPDRLVYPNHGMTKRDVVDFYRAVAPVLVPHLHGHPVTLKRYTDDTTGPSFWEKDAPAFTPKWVERFAVARRGGGAPIQYIVVNDARTLEWCAAVGTLEFHPFLACVPQVDSPAAVVFDLDPGVEGADILNSAAVALMLRELLSRLNLQAFPKVSGSRGIQVYVPLNTPVSYAATQSFARAITETLHAEHSDLIVAEMDRNLRKGRVFIDWSQNADFKTTVGVYSLRAKRHRPWVSLPVAWDELEAAIASRNKSALYVLAPAAIQRIDRVGDLFAPVLRLKQALPEPFASIAPANAASTPRIGKAGVRAAEQGGRRTFRLMKDALVLDFDDARHAWRLPNGIPTRAGQISPAVESPNSARSDDPRDSGTYELVEGSFRRGYLHLYFSGDSLRRDYVLARNGSAWALSKGTAGKWPETAADRQKH